MKKGFTLIELLAVILILGIIAVIVVPTVSAIIKKAKIKSFVASAQGIVKTATLMSGENGLDGISNDTITLSNLEYKGKRYEIGSITFDDEGEVAIAIWNPALEICATKDYEDSVVTVDTTITDEEDCTLVVSNTVDLVVGDAAYSCYTFDAPTRTITDIHPNLTTCDDLVIPTTIDAVPVENIEDWATDDVATVNTVDFSKAVNMINIGDYAINQYYEGTIDTLTFSNMPNLSTIGGGVFRLSAGDHVLDLSTSNSIVSVAWFLFDGPWNTVTILLPTDPTARANVITGANDSYCFKDTLAGSCIVLP